MGDLEASCSLTWHSLFAQIHGSWALKTHSSAQDKSVLGECLAVLEDKRAPCSQGKGKNVLILKNEAQ